MTKSTFVGIHMDNLFHYVIWTIEEKTFLYIEKNIEIHFKYWEKYFLNQANSDN